MHRIKDINDRKLTITHIYYETLLNRKLNNSIIDIPTEINQQYENTKFSNDYIFIDNSAIIDGFKRNMKTYLERKINLINDLTRKNIALKNHYFRRLMGRHLYFS